MKTLSSVIAALLSAALLAACGGRDALTYRSAPLSALPSQRQASIDQLNTSGPTLYVLNSGGGQAFGVTVYSGGGASLLRIIGIGKYSDGFTVDASGKLYVGYPVSQGDPAGPGLLNIYSSRGAKLVRTLQQTHPFGLLTLDPSGNLYTLCAADRLCEYASARQQVIRKIALRKFNAASYALAVDSTGNLAVDSGSFVLVFAPGKTTPYWKITGTNAGAIAFDASGDLYVANSGSCCGNSSIAVYAPGGTSPIRTITDQNGQYLEGLAFDASGDLYVLSFCLNQCGLIPAVTVYSPGGSTPIRTITNGLVNGDALTMILDQSANLYVSNGGFPDTGSVVVYPPGGTSPIRTVTHGIQNPFALGIGP